MGIVAEAPRARLRPRGGRAFGAELAARFFGLPLEAKGSVDLAAGTADLSFDGSVSPEFTAPLSEWTGANIRKYADMTQPVAATGSIRFLPGWKLGDVRGRVDTRKFTCYSVSFDEARGYVTYDGIHLVASGAVVRSGDNLALGSYEQNFQTLEFRYLLTGRLRPLYISPWFGGDWWTGIFGNFAFPVQPPDASIDVQGRYARGASFFVYGYADSKQPVIRGVALDEAKVLLSVDPTATDGYHVVLTRGAGTAEGSFKLSTDASKGGLWSALDIDARSRRRPRAGRQPAAGRRGGGDLRLLLRQAAVGGRPRALRRTGGGGPPAQEPPRRGPLGRAAEGSRRGASIASSSSWTWTTTRST